jgi:hypothetical protein
MNMKVTDIKKDIISNINNVKIEKNTEKYSSDIKHLTDFYLKDQKSHGQHVGGVFSKNVTIKDKEKFQQQNNNENKSIEELFKKSKYKNKWMIKSDNKKELDGSLTREYGSVISEYLANGQLSILLGQEFVPKIRLVQDDKNKQVLLASKFFDECSDLQKVFVNKGKNVSNQVVHIKNSYINKFPNFHEIIVASLLVGDFDFHPSNIVVTSSNNTNVFAKIDHGKAFSDMKMKKIIEKSFNKFSYDIDILKSEEFFHAVEKMLLTDREKLYEKLADDIKIVEKNYGAKIENTEFATKKLGCKSDVLGKLQQQMDSRFKELEDLYQSLLVNHAVESNDRSMTFKVLCGNKDFLQKKYSYFDTNKDGKISISKCKISAIVKKNEKKIENVINDNNKKIQFDNDNDDLQRLKEYKMPVIDDKKQTSTFSKIKDFLGNIKDVITGKDYNANCKKIENNRSSKDYQKDLENYKSIKLQNPRKISLSTMRDIGKLLGIDKNKDRLSLRSRFDSIENLENKNI